MQGREMTMTAGEIERVVTEVARSYPPPLDGIELADVTRIAFHLSILSEHVPAGGHVVDIGGGIGLMSVGAAALGYRSTLVDDFDDAVNYEYPIESLGVHARRRRGRRTGRGQAASSSATRTLSWRRTVVCLGLSQLICWGITYYLIGALGELMVADLGWSSAPWSMAASPPRSW